MSADHDTSEGTKQGQKQHAADRTRHKTRSCVTRGTKGQLPLVVGFPMAVVC